MDYINGFVTHCQQDWDLSCSAVIMQDMKINEKVQQCVSSTFTGNNMYVDDNTLLKAERQHFWSRNVAWYPAVIIDNQLVRGNMDKLDVFDEICKSMKNKKQYCDAIISEDDPLKWNVNFKTGDMVVVQVDNTRIIE